MTCCEEDTTRPCKRVTWATSYWVVRAGVSEEVTFELRPE